MKILINAGEMLLVTRIAGYLLVLPWMLRKLDIRELVRKATPAASPRDRGSIAADRIMYLCEQTMRRFRRVGYRHTCLRRSIVMYRFLRSFGFPVKINFGARWVEKQLTGHSWLTLDGDVLFDRREDVERFTFFFSLPDTPREESTPVSSDNGDGARLDRVAFD